MADEKKVWYKSKTIWSDVLTLALVIYGGLATILGEHGINLPAMDSPMFGFVLSVLAGIGIHGRVVSTGKITLTSPK